MLTRWLRTWQHRRASRRARALLPQDLAAGDVFSVRDGSVFKIVKLLAYDDGGAHIRLFKERFDWRPERVDTRALSLGSVHDPDGFGMGHFPIVWMAFAGWQPVRLHHEEVAEDELDGYRMWAEAGAGYWD